MGTKNFGNHAFMKDPLNYSYYYIFEIDFLKEAAEADKEYNEKMKQYKKDQVEYSEGRSFGKPVKPVHQFRNQIVKMRPGDPEILYYPDEIDDDEDAKPQDWDASSWAKVSEHDIVDVLESRVSHRQTPEKDKWGYSPKGKPVLPTTHLPWEAVEDLDKLEDQLIKDEKASTGREVSGIPLYMYGENPQFKAFVDSYIKKTLDTFFEAEPRFREHDMAEEFLTTEVAVFFMAQEYASQYKNMKAKVEAYRQDLRNTKISECPHIPLIKESLFPHQAIALAKAHKSKTAILDVGTGGGKTLILLADALVLLKEGKIKKALMVMPEKTIKQQRAKVKAYCRGKLNVIIVNSATWASARAKAKISQRILDKGDKRQIDQARNEAAKEFFANLIRKAPPNTVIFSTYSWLRMGEKIGTGRMLEQKDGSLVEEKETYHFKASWLIDDCGIDYVALDESHHIKNAETAQGQSVRSLSRAPYRRLATATLVPNGLQDLWAQASFIDPTLFGKEEEFINHFALEAVPNRGKWVVKEWKKDAPKVMRSMLQNVGLISARRSHWLHLLPERIERVTPVYLSPTQQKAYEVIYNSVMEEILDDPAMQKLMEKLRELEGKEDPEMESTEAFDKLLKLLVKLDQFLTAPEKYNGMTIKTKARSVKLLLPPGEEVSPKVAVCDRILEEHFANPKNGKVIIFVQHKESAAHFVKHLKLKKWAVYYDAQAKANLDKFMKDPNVKILCAVDASLKEGMDLQVANRIIRADIRWSPGDMEQSYGRIFRPGARMDAKVYINILCTDNTAEVTKYAQLVTKYHNTSQFDSDYEASAESQTKLAQRISMNPHTMETLRSIALLDPFQRSMNDIAANEKVENEKNKLKYGTKMIEGYTHPDMSLPNAAIIDTPRLPKDEEGIDADDEDTDTGDTVKVTRGSERQIVIYYTIDKRHTKKDVLMITDTDAEALDTRILKSYKFKYDGTFKPQPVWYRRCSSSASVQKKLKAFKTEGVDFVLVKGLPGKQKIKSDDQGKAKSVEPKNEAENLLIMDLFNADGWIYLRVPKDQDNAKDLKGSPYKFEWKGRLFQYRIKSRSAGLLMLQRIQQKGIKIDNLKDVVREIKTDKLIPGKTAPVGILEQLKRMTQKQKKGHVEIYYGVWDNIPMLYARDKEAKADLAVLKTLGFKHDTPAYWKLLTRDKVYPYLKRLMKGGYKISNFEMLMKGLKRWRINRVGLEGLEPEDEEIAAKSGSFTAKIAHTDEEMFNLVQEFRLKKS